MTWLDDLRDASFRGAPFTVTSHEASGGRRLALHQYPLRDRPYPEDMGREAGRFEVVGFILGADYFPARDRLINACEEAGPGLLVHPFLGERTVAIERYRVSETTGEGGMCRITMECVEGGEPDYPAPSADAGAVLTAAAAAARTAAVDRFRSEWQP